ncbi:hypothetical protein [Elioraea sp.]|uniref:hypothetical protein n=1 Tax=Elioraea sp. TaxID=2185103 RepID=UPI0025C3305E|nr:hypothetical protein [Elioraea sp.]
MSLIPPAGRLFLDAAVAAWWARHGSTTATPDDDGVTLPAVIRGAIAPSPPQPARDAVRRALADGVLRAEALFDDGITEPIPPEFWRSTAGARAMWPGERVSVPSRPLTARMLPSATLPVVVNAPRGRPIVSAGDVRAWLDGREPVLTGAPGADPEPLARGGVRTEPRSAHAPLSERARSLIRVQEEALRTTGKILPQISAQEKVEPDGPKGRWSGPWAEVKRHRPELSLKPERPRGAREKSTN